MPPPRPRRFPAVALVNHAGAGEVGALCRRLVYAAKRFARQTRHKHLAQRRRRRATSFCRLWWAAAQPCLPVEPRLQLRSENVQRLRQRSHVRERHVPPFKHGLQPLLQLRRPPLCSTSPFPRYSGLPRPLPRTPLRRRRRLPPPRRPWAVGFTDRTHQRCTRRRARAAAHAHCGERRTEQPVAQKIGLWVAARQGGGGDSARDAPRHPVRIAWLYSRAHAATPRRRSATAEAQGTLLTAHKHRILGHAPVRPPSAVSARQKNIRQAAWCQAVASTCWPRRAASGGGEKRRGGLTVP